MATIDLGKIKLVWRGTYNNSTAYTVDDVVEYTDSGITSTYICVANSTGNAPSSSGTAHASWNYMAKGIADPIPSQSGNSGKFLKTNGSALSFDDAGAWTKIAAGTGPSSAVTSISISNIFSDTYKWYRIYVSFRQDDWLKCRFIRSSDNGTQTYGAYVWAMVHTFEDPDGGPERQGGHNDSYIPLQFWNATDAGFSVNVMTAWNPYSSSTKTGFQTDCDFNENNQLHSHKGSGFYNANESHQGLTIFGSNGDAMSDSNFSYLVLGAKE